MKKFACCSSVALSPCSAARGSPRRLPSRVTCPARTMPASADAASRRTPVSRRSISSSSWRRSSASRSPAATRRSARAARSAASATSRSASARTSFRVDFPQVEQLPRRASTGARSRSAADARTSVVGLPTADAAIGIFKGIPLGAHERRRRRPAAQRRPTSRRRHAATTFSVDAGPQPARSATACASACCQESIARARRLGHVSEARSADDDHQPAPRGNDSLHRHATSKVKTTAWRLVASKSLHRSSASPAGVGQDKYDVSDSRATCHGHGRTSPTPSHRRPVTLSQNADAHELLRRSVAQPAALQDRRRGRAGDRAATVDDVQHVRRLDAPTSRARTARSASASASSMA